MYFIGLVVYLKIKVIIKNDKLANIFIHLNSFGTIETKFYVFLGAIGGYILYDREKLITIIVGEKTFFFKYLFRVEIYSIACYIVFVTFSKLKKNGKISASLSNYQKKKTGNYYV